MASSELVKVACTMAQKGAVEYLRANKLTAAPATLAECLTSAVKRYLPSAIRDAQEAMEAHMPKAAEQTFAASMVLAGIDAAKECCIAA